MRRRAKRRALAVKKRRTKRKRLTKKPSPPTDGGSKGTLHAGDHADPGICPREITNGFPGSTRKGHQALLQMCARLLRVGGRASLGAGILFRPDWPLADC